MEPRFPQEYRHFWEPYTASSALYHLTTRENYNRIMREGVLLPRDPAPNQWAGLAAVFLTDPNDLFFDVSYASVLNHVRTKHHDVVRLHVRTQNPLWRSNEGGISQIVSLRPISFSEIINVEHLRTFGI